MPKVLDEDLKKIIYGITKELSYEETCQILGAVLNKYYKDNENANVEQMQKSSYVIYRLLCYIIDKKIEAQNVTKQ